MLIDTHAHLQFPKLKENTTEIIANAKQVGVDYIINVGTNMDSSRESIALAENYKNVFATVGVHPHDASEVTEDNLKQLELMCNHAKVVGLGEIGLDFFKNRAPYELQISSLKKLFALTHKINLPIVIHCREAHEKMKEIITEFAPFPSGGVLHCFSGTIEDAEFYLNNGLLISFTGNITYPNAQNLRDVVKFVPIENILLETDCPFLAPQSHRGKTNQPSFISEICKQTADIKGLSFNDVSRITTRNANDLFKLNVVENAPQIAYIIRNSLYLNITNKCTNSCDFCIRFSSDYVKGYNLNLKHYEPSAEELIKNIKEFRKTDYDEIVFCGFGEPTMKLDVIKKVAKWIKDNTEKKIRINTNGQGNLINNTSVPKELSGLIDNYTISINAENAEKYTELCKPSFGSKAFEKILEFAKEAKQENSEVVFTAVTAPGVNIQNIENLTKELGIQFRKREYNVVG